MGFSNHKLLKTKVNIRAIRLCCVSLINEDNCGIFIFETDTKLELK